ncbi:hypothetical protein ABC347_07990 [Sphingomonas sp. 1P06PA]
MPGDGLDRLIAHPDFGEAARYGLAQPVSRTVLQTGGIALATEIAAEPVHRERLAEAGPQERRHVGHGLDRNDGLAQILGNWQLDRLTGLVLHIGQEAILDIRHAELRCVTFAGGGPQHQFECEPGHGADRMPRLIGCDLILGPGVVPLRLDLHAVGFFNRVVGAHLNLDRIFEQPAKLLA